MKWSNRDFKLPRMRDVPAKVSVEHPALLIRLMACHPQPGTVNVSRPSLAEDAQGTIRRLRMIALTPKRLKQITAGNGWQPATGEFCAHLRQCGFPAWLYPCRPRTVTD
jgi:hypothetical protein